MKTTLRIALALSLLTLPLSAFGKVKGNDTLQLHVIDVGQADCILLISPKGETVLWDSGRSSCSQIKAYLQQLGIQSLEYLITTHYDADHIGCTKNILEEFPVDVAAYDRGGSKEKDTQTFQNYLEAVGNKRETVEKGKTFVLDKGNPDSIVIKVVAVNANGIKKKGKLDENDLSVACVVTYNNFDAFLGGDLSGYNTSKFVDVETRIADEVGRVEVYKVSHHGSQYSSNEKFLENLKPVIGIISVGAKNSYHHPTSECLKRLHDAGINTYWTEEGEGANPVPGSDVIGGDIVIQVPPRSNTFTVTHNNNKTDTYSVWEKYAVTTVVTPPPDRNAKYAWSTIGKVYHYKDCSWAKKIKSQNLQTGIEPPEGRPLHKGCPVK